MRNADETLYVEMKLHEEPKAEFEGCACVMELPVGCVGILYVYKSKRLPKLLDEDTEFTEIRIKKDG